ncbi:MAG: 3-hydroxyacyl-CoA dehydrogenase [Alphaproteobacteria bacterium]|nr:3-hydroxyacyl-CoA dehydrogenase [Alphaproteobacteria bacterium]
MADRAVIVGRGIIGCAWAVAFARGGFDVVLAGRPGVDDIAARTRIAAGLADLEGAGLIASASVALTRVKSASSLREAMAGAAIAIESLPENVDLKRTCFAEMDAAAPPACLLGSSTSGIPASQFTEGLTGRSRCLVTHPANPPFLLPAVELVPAPWTAPEAMERCRTLMARAGMSPVVMKKEIPGFVISRLLAAVINEAVGLVAGGYVDVDGVERAVKDALGLRWSFMGPLETMAINAPGGFRDAAERFGPGLRARGKELFVGNDWNPGTIALVHEQLMRLIGGDVEARQRWRDQRLAALATHKAAMTNQVGS